MEQHSAEDLLRIVRGTNATLPDSEMPFPVTDSNNSPERQNNPTDKQRAAVKLLMSQHANAPRGHSKPQQTQSANQSHNHLASFGKINILQNNEQIDHKVY